MNWVRDMVTCQLLASSFRNDIYFQLFFRPGVVGALARLLFFADELAARRKNGLVLKVHGAVALVGVPPLALLQESDLCAATKFALGLQGGPYAAAWQNAWRDGPAASGDKIYLSAIATIPRERRRGVGSKLLEQVKQIASDRQLPLACEVAADDILGWYLRRGFRVVGVEALPADQRLYKLLWDSNSASESGRVKI